MASHLNVAALLSLSLRCVRISCNSWSYLEEKKWRLPGAMRLLNLDLDLVDFYWQMWVNIPNIDPIGMSIPNLEGLNWSLRDMVIQEQKHTAVL